MIQCRRQREVSLEPRSRSLRRVLNGPARRVACFLSLGSSDGSGLVRAKLLRHAPPTFQSSSRGGGRRTRIPEVLRRLHLPTAVYGNVSVSVQLSRTGVILFPAPPEGHGGSSASAIHFYTPAGFYSVNGGLQKKANQAPPSPRFRSCREDTHLNHQIIT